MKTPIAYYGGKLNMLRHILPLIPPHTTYTEPFCGGAALFFAKPPAPCEVINDTNDLLINLYEVMQGKGFERLQSLVLKSLHSRKCFEKALLIFNNPQYFNRVEKAWAVWLLCAQGFSHKLNGTWGYEKKSGSTSKAFANRKYAFTKEIKDRLNAVQIECTDALRVIKSRDSASALHYVDPPYINTNCGHYVGYTSENYVELLQTLAGIQGKFILSSFPTKELDEAVSKNGWRQLSFEKSLAVNGKATNSGRRKIEVITMNF